MGKGEIDIGRLLIATIVVPLALIALLHWLAGSGGILVD